MSESQDHDQSTGSAYPPSIQAGIPKLGPRPEGWHRFPLGELLRVVERPAKLVDSTVYQLVTAKRGRGGIVARERLLGSQILTKTQFSVDTGDFVISNRQISHGACGLVPAALKGAVVSNEYTVLHPSRLLDQRYLGYLSHSTYFQQTCFHSSIGVHVEKLVFRLNDWFKWQFDVPALAEQRRIVAVLAAWDQAIATVERLTVAKQQRKSALQDILFRNLPNRPLLEAANVWFSGVDKKSVPGEAPVQLCNYMDVFHNTHITSGIDFMRATASAREIANNHLRRHDVVFTKDSETADEIAECALVAENIEGLVCGYHLAVARPHNSRCFGPYLAQALRHPRVRWQFSRLANGVVRFGLTLDALEQIEIPLPSLGVQDGIAGALDAEDHAIKALRMRSAALRTQKRALMKKLLTGEWRLNERFDPAALPPGLGEAAA